VSTYTIGEVAARSGFSSSALRYYERIGLVAPSTRTEAGYRMYDDGALARLAFIARAKQLGCSLQEVTDLVEIWDGERCVPVQRRFHELVTDKIAGTEHQVAELVAFAGQLRAAAAQLSGPPTDAPCNERCACAEPPDASAPIACTLETEILPGRIAEWQALLGRASERRPTEGNGWRIRFDAAVPVEDIAQLARAEQGCCEFFAFAITIDRRGIALEVHSPPEARDILNALFGA
jgi:DNA-binding transcriptional MerR regulator